MIRTAMSGMKHPISKYKDIVPFVIPSVHRFLSKFIYISPNVIVKVSPLCPLDYVLCNSQSYCLTLS